MATDSIRAAPGGPRGRGFSVGVVPDERFQAARLTRVRASSPAAA
jgi:hypothetical protein